MGPGPLGAEHFSSRAVCRSRPSGSSSGAPLTLPLPGLLLAAAAAWGALQVAAGWSVDRVTTLDAALNWVTNLAAFALAADLYRNRDQRDHFLRSVLIFTGILAVVSIFTFLTSPTGKVFWIFDSGSESRALGPFVYKNQYAAFVEAVLPLAILGMINDRRRWLLHAMIVATLFGSVVAGGSRAGTIPMSRRNFSDPNDRICPQRDPRRNARASAPGKLGRRGRF